MDHYTPTRDEWEQEKRDQEHDYWSWVNAEAEAFIKDADTGRINIEKIPDMEILKRIGEIVDIAPYDMSGVNQGTTSIIYKQTIFFFKN